MLMGGGTAGNRSARNQPASVISAGWMRISPAACSAVKATMRESGNGQGWLPK